MVVKVFHIVFTAVIGKVKVVGHCRIFGSQGVDLFHNRHYTGRFTQCPHTCAVGNRIEFVFHHSPGNLEITETLLLGKFQQIGGEGFDGVVIPKLVFSLDDMLQFLQEPTVDFCQLVDALNRITFMQSLGKHEYAFVGRFFKSLIHIADFQVTIAHKTMHALAYHTQPLLNHLFECAADSHNLAYRLHRRTDFTTHPMEFA